MNNDLLQLLTLVLEVYFALRIHHTHKNVNVVKVRVSQMYNKLMLFLKFFILLFKIIIKHYYLYYK